MSHIIQLADNYLQTLQSVFPKKVHHLLEFGFKALSLQRITSLNSNARSTVSNPHTAESKIYRLTGNLRLGRIFPSLLVKLNLVKENDIIAVDFSDFHGINVLMFAKQTRSGRTIPLYFDFLTYPIEKGSQNIFIIQTIVNFLDLIKPLEIRLVFDRGFAIPALVEYLAQVKVIFYLRINGIKMVEYGNKSIKAKDFPEGKYLVNAYDNRLALTITPKPDNADQESTEPWYIVSNDLISSKKQIQEIYYYRFEIEELFKDAKRIFGLEYLRFKIPLHFKTVLWFVMIGIWLHYYLDENLEKAKSLIKKCRNSFNQSITHYWLEKIRLALQLPVLEEIFIKYG